MRTSHGTFPSNTTVSSRSLPLYLHALITRLIERSSIEILATYRPSPSSMDNAVQLVEMMPSPASPAKVAPPAREGLFMSTSDPRPEPGILEPGILEPLEPTGGRPLGSQCPAGRLPPSGARGPFRADGYWRRRIYPCVSSGGRAAIGCLVLGFYVPSIHHCGIRD